jgi:S1-C subfamily serine protease
VKLLGNSYQTRHCGLQAGDVVVAINGHRVHTQAQYNVFLDSAPGLTFQIIYWRGGQYQETSTMLHTRRFGVNVATFAP